MEGATAVKVPDELVVTNGPEDLLFPWLEQIHAGFATLQRALSDHPEYLEKGDGPAGILARVLNRADLHADLLGYTAPNAYFFGTTMHSTVSSNEGRAAFATRLGYWLLNYILARYAGPFDGLDGGFYWRQGLIDLVLDAGGDIANTLDDGAEPLERVDSNPFGQAYYCLVNNVPIAAKDAAISPDWIPPGATMSRINQDELDELGPMLNI